MPCQSPRELKHFYCRQGKLLALGFVLRMTDLYCENILAVGEHPVVVDAESIMDVMHPEDLRNPLWFALDQSLLALGLLPWPIAGQGDSVLDISGLAGGRDEDDESFCRSQFWMETGETTQESSIAKFLYHRLRINQGERMTILDSTHT